jgi:sulfatase modifying factor 1
MSGNVWEWVWDWYADSYTGAATTDPRGPSAGDNRVLRGGARSTAGRSTRASRSRYWFTPPHRGLNAGFRLARSYP